MPSCVAVTSGTFFNYVFNYTDHLGNIRLSYTENNFTGEATIMEENHYYPFGLKHKAYNTQGYTFVLPMDGTPGYNVPQLMQEDEMNPNPYNYKYNGKELQEELGLNLYDYGARNYDAAIGRWMNIDPLAELYYPISTYTYVANNPLRFIDPNGMEIINGETARRERLQALKDGNQQRMNEKHNGNMNMSKTDFASKEEYNEYKANREAFKDASKALDKSIATEAKIQASIDDFKVTDPTNFNLANNLTFKDSNGNVQNIDITIKAGNAYEYGGAVTKTGFVHNADGTYNSIGNIITTMDYSVVKPISNVLAHEMGHAYNNAQNPVKAMQDTTTHNCQDPANRNTFQSKTAMDWQQSYDKLKAAQVKK